MTAAGRSPSTDAARAAPRALPGDREAGLSRRMARLTLSTSAVALLVAGALLNAAAHLLERRSLADSARMQAQVLATNAAAALLFGDADAAREVLNSLGSAPMIDRARLLTVRGQTFAAYERAVDPAASPRSARPAAQPAPAQMPSDMPSDMLASPASRAASAAVAVAATTDFVALHRISVSAPVRQSGRLLGALVVEVPLAPLYQRTLLFGGITLAAALLAMLLSHRMAVGVRRDVDRIEHEMLDMAFIDPVTQLDNRHAARLDLARQVAAADRRSGGFAVVSLDLDDFKAVNDTLGHLVGDQVLRTVAQRLVAALPSDARAYRLGGDEFLVVSPATEGGIEPLRLGQHLRQALSGSVHLAGVDVALGGSFGVARYPQDGATAEAVLTSSDLAMYRSKRNGKQQVTVFDVSLRAETEQRLRIEVELRRALADGEFRLVYQPLYAADGRLTAAEALVRWQHPQRGLVSPADFIPVAERTGLIVELGGWVLGEAARQVAQWQAEGLPRIAVAVNVSPRQLRGGVLLAQYRQALAQAGCAPEQLSIELTENSLVEDIDENLSQLQALRALGTQIAIDDFGTGQSSLSYMKRLPVDKLKIDRSFVSGLPDDRGDRAIVAAAVSMAHALGLEVVAEGVETAAQAQWLLAAGVDLLQGYHLGRPAPPQALAERLRAQARPSEAPADLIAAG